MAAPLLSILLPVRNEGESLSIMLRVLRSSIEIPHEVIVITDSPEDTSIPVVKTIAARYAEVRHVGNRLGPGVGNAIAAGIEASRGEYILIFAADEVAPVIAIDPMLEKMVEGFDVVSVTRYARGGRRLGGSFIQGVMSRTANFVFRALTGFPLTDATTGMRMVRREHFDKIEFESNPVGWAVAFEMSIKFYLLGLKMTEVPVVSIDRLYGGKSSFRAASWSKEYWRWFMYGLREVPKARRAGIVK
jgi:dolichol-phosphate mannosyltransferase